MVSSSLEMVGTSLVFDKNHRSRWRSGLALFQQGHAICEDLGSSPTYDQWVFFTCNKVSLLNDQILTLKSCAMRPIYLARAYQGLHVKQAKKNGL